ncbi:MAG: MerR family transcriptional regulator [Gammaproteobacteria bacterium]|nr:MAG: MerR family transcriptional regulator [Gammaproteobacteria bacterium]
MLDVNHNILETTIPSKKYFSIGEVSKLCGVLPHVLRYWEEEFPQLSPVKKKGNRRYYRHSDIKLVLKIKYVLHDQGLTISGANKYFLSEKSNSNKNSTNKNYRIKKDLEEILDILSSNTII